jgi:hypothetical protein
MLQVFMKLKKMNLARKFMPKKIQGFKKMHKIVL